MNEGYRSGRLLSIIIIVADVILNPLNKPNPLKNPKIPEKKRQDPP